jgi:cytoskeletal protein CcmA (bactofilin family)
MSDMIELSAGEIEMVAGGRIVGNITVQNNINVNPQVAIGIAVLSPNARVNANNNSFTLQLNVAASA